MVTVISQCCLDGCHYFVVRFGWMMLSTTIQGPLGLTIFVQNNSNVHRGLWMLACTKIQFLQTVDSNHAEAIRKKR